MYLDDNEDFDLVGETTIPDDDVDTTSENEQDESSENSERGTESATENVADDEEKPDEEEASDEADAKKDSKVQALDSERARRKQAEKELKELKAQILAEKMAKEDAETAVKEREAYKQKMLEGDLIDEETANKLLDVFGDDIIKGKIANQRRAEQAELDNAIAELKKNDKFMDADVYKPQIQELMKKGLTAEQAYMASLSEGRFLQLKNDLRVEAEQKFLNRSEKADAVDVGVAQAKGEAKKGTYTKREQEIAKETGLSVAEVHKRSKIFTMDEIEKL